MATSKNKSASRSNTQTKSRATEAGTEQDAREKPQEGQQTTTELPSARATESKSYPGDGTDANLGANEPEGKPKSGSPQNYGIAGD